MAADRADYDSPWKEILERFFPEFLAFFFPDIHNNVDWSRPYEFMESELQQVMRDGETGRRRVDKVVKVWREGGQEARVLIHVEVQGWKEEDFDERMYVYNYRLYDHQQVPVASLAVLTDERADWQPDRFEYAIWGVEVRLKFRTAKLLNYRTQWQQLEQEPNPFAVVVMAHLKTLETQHDPQDRRQWKFTLTRLLYERGYSREDVLEVFRFIDWIMTLPPTLDRQFVAELEAFEEAQRMRYVTTIERIAEERGIEQGIEQGIERTLRKATLDVLEERFDAVPESIGVALEAVQDRLLLERLLRQAVTVESPAAFAEILSRTVSDNGTTGSE